MNLPDDPNLIKLVDLWNIFQSEVKEIQTICTFPQHIKDKVEKIDSLISSINQNSSDIHLCIKQICMEWENIYDIILDPTSFFEIDQAIEVLKNKELILKTQEDVTLEDANKFSLFVMAFTSLQKSWKEFYAYHPSSQSFAQYIALINEMSSFIEVIMTEPEHQNTAQELRGIETVLSSLLNITSNFHFYEKFLNSAVEVSSIISTFQPKSE